MNEPLTVANIGVQEFWDTKYQTSNYSRSLGERGERAVKSALDYFGDVRGKIVLDLGCGAGASSIFFASHGANVIAADISPVAISAVKSAMEQSGLSNITPILIDRPFFGEIGAFDFVFGSMILHHIEPFTEFCPELAKRLRQKGFFYENNAFSKILIWFRTNIVGRLWVPKHGDDEEFPLMPSEIDELRKYFEVEIEMPEMVFAELVSTYILRKKLYAATKGIDKWMYKNNLLTNCSYYQFVKLDCRV